MAARSSGAIAIVESAYDLDSSDDGWLAELTRTVMRASGSAPWSVALEFDSIFPPGSIVQRVCTPALDPTQSSWVRRAFTIPTLDHALGATVGPIDSFPAVTRLSERGQGSPRVARIFSPFARRLGFDDLIAATAHDGSGRGVLFNLPVSARSPRPNGIRTVALALPHVSAGLRLRRALKARSHAMGEPPYGAELVLDEAGIVRDGDATPSDKEVLRAAVLARDRARSARSSPEEAVEAWTALVDGRWSLVDSFERNGRRYVVAVPNVPDVLSPRRLAALERAVVALVLLGRSNKAIGYELGLAEGTVAAYLRDARRKLGGAASAAPTDRTSVERMRVGDAELVVVVTTGDDGRVALLVSLTPAERAVVRAALDGLSTSRIAALRSASERTVANQLASAYRKLAVGSRRELVARLRRGLGDE